MNGHATGHAMPRHTMPRHTTPMATWLREGFMNIIAAIIAAIIATKRNNPEFGFK